MSGFSPIDLSRLPAPQVIETPDFEAMLSEMKARTIELDPDLAPFLELESEPATKLLQVCAYFRMLDRLAFNDGARACMLALATGSDLDNLAAFWGVERLIVQAADETVTPPIAEITESDEALRQRTQLSLEAHTTAGSRGSYMFWALTASGSVRDAAIENMGNGEIRVTVLAQGGDGTPDAALLQTVASALDDETVRPLSDQVSVAAPTVLPFTVTAELTLYDGPEASMVLAAAQAELDLYLNARFRLGHDVTRSGLFAALHREGVQNVVLTDPAADLVIAANEVAYCAPEAVTLTIGGRDV